MLGLQGAVLEAGKFDNLWKVQQLGRPKAPSLPSQRGIDLRISVSVCESLKVRLV